MTLDQFFTEACVIAAKYELHQWVKVECGVYRLSEAHKPRHDYRCSIELPPIQGTGQSDCPRKALQLLEILCQEAHVKSMPATDQVSEIESAQESEVQHG